MLPVPANPLRVPKKIFAPPHPPQAEGEESLEFNVSIHQNYCNGQQRSFDEHI